MMKKIFRKYICSLLGLCIAASVIPTVAHGASLESELSFAENAAGFTVTLPAPQTGDYYQLWLSKKGGTLEQLASVNDEKSFNERVSYVDFCMAYHDRTPIVFNVDLSSTEDYGAYAVRIIRTAAGGTLDEAYYSFRYVDPTLSIRAVKDFMTVSDNAEFQRLVKKYVEEEFFDSQQLGILSDPDVVGKIGSRFAMVRDIEYRDGMEFPSANSIIECAGAAYVVEQLLGSDVQKAIESVARYGSFLAEYMPDEQITESYMEVLSCARDYLLDGESLETVLKLSKDFCSRENMEKTFAVHKELRQHIKDLDSFEDVLLWSAALSSLDGANRAEIEEGITQNAELFGLELSPEAHYGMSLAQVARYFSPDNVANLYGKAQFGNYYDAMAKKAAETNKNESKGSGGTKSKGQKYSGDVAQLPINSELGSAENVSEKKLPFCDLNTVPWAVQYIVELYQKGVINGVDEENFAPDRAVSREEFVKMLVLAFHISEEKMMNFEFSDVVQDMWSYPYIKKAFMGGIVNGVDKNYFGAKENITRQDAAVMLSKVIELWHGSGDEEELLPYADKNEIAQYAKFAVSIVGRRGIMKGIDEQNFAPHMVTTRAQAATLIGRILEQTGGEQ